MSCFSQSLTMMKRNNIGLLKNKHNYGAKKLNYLPLKSSIQNEWTLNYDNNSIFKFRFTVQHVTWKPCLFHKKNVLTIQ
jgi:hypothetical protein